MMHELPRDEPAWRRYLRVSGDDAAADVDDELRFHVDMIAEKYLREGMTATEARARALAEFGDIERARQLCHEADRQRLRRQRRTEWLTALGQELRGAARRLVSSSGFTAIAIVTLGLGIGANTAVFSVIYPALLRPLPYPGADRLVQLWETTPGQERRAVAPANFLDWRAENDVFAQLAAYDLRTGTMLDGAEPERVAFATVSANFFLTLGVPAVAGRTFREDDPGAGAGRAAVLSHELWQRRFASDTAVIGTTLEMDEEVLTVVGVASPRLEFPSGAALYIRAPFDVPELSGVSQDVRAIRDAWYFRVIGRLRSGVSIEQARAGMDGIADRLEAAYPRSNDGRGITLVPLHEQLVGDVRLKLLLLLGAVALVLLVACTNVASLLLMRVRDKRVELAVRAALGASRARLVIYLLAESLVLAAGGGVLGIALAIAGTRLLSATLPGSLAVGSIELSAPVLAFALGLSAMVVLLAGAIPAMRAARVELHSALGERARSGAPGRGRWQGTFVVGEVALAFVLVVGAGLMLQSLLRLHAVEPGFRPDGLITLRVSMPDARARPRAEVSGYYGNVIDAISAVPGVTSAAVSLSGPLDDGPGAGLRIEGRYRGEGSLPDNSWQQVTPDYFRAAGIPLVAGRALDERDREDSPPVAVINETMADLHWPGATPIGQRINTGLDGSEGVWVTIVGVAGDTKNEALTEPASPEMYRPLAQPARFPASEMMVLVRARRSDTALLQSIRSAIWSVRRDVPIYDLRTGDELLRSGTAEPRSIAFLLATFAGLALALGGIGVYGVASYAVRQRRREFGIRMALGASASSVVAMVVRSGMLLVTAGAAIGLCVSLGATRVLRAQLFGISPTDPATLVAVPMVLVIVGLVALAAPASRAGDVDPAEVLREE